MSKAVIAVQWDRMEYSYNKGVQEEGIKLYGYSIHLSKTDAKQYIKETAASSHNSRFVPKELYLALVSDPDYRYLTKLWYEGKLGYSLHKWMIEDVTDVAVENLGDLTNRYVKLLGTDDLTKATLEKINAEQQ